MKDTDSTILSGSYRTPSSAPPSSYSQGRGDQEYQSLTAVEWIVDTKITSRNPHSFWIALLLSEVKMDIPQQQVPTTKAAQEVAGIPPAAEEAESYELRHVGTKHNTDRYSKEEKSSRGSTHMPSQEHHAHFDLPPGEPKDPEESLQLPVVDIEHAPVDDDPREWSHKKKVCSCTWSVGDSLAFPFPRLSFWP
jgi:hypothetical protein